jgi:hypothetical protein
MHVSLLVGLAAFLWGIPYALTALTVGEVSSAVVVFARSSPRRSCAASR